MFRILILLTVLHLFNASTWAEIREISSLRQILPEIAPGTLLVFDLDNTLIEPEGNLGSDQWFYFLERKFHEHDGLAAVAAEQKAMAVWNRVQPALRIRTVEADTARLIRAEQQRGIATLGLTARTADVAATTIAQLRGVGIRLDRRTVPTGKSAWRDTASVVFRHGVIFVGEGTDKGRALVNFLRRTGVHPSRLLFVDDKRSHVVNVDRAAREAGWPCVAYRYGAADRKVAQFNRDTRDLMKFLGESKH